MNKSPVNLISLISTLQDNSELPVVFKQGDQAIAQGYHISEVKYATIEALDCGQGKEHWNELVIQLLDGNRESVAGYMNGRKILNILDKALNDIEQHDQTKLLFEYASMNTELRILHIETITVVNCFLVISLNGSSAQCKPFERVRKMGSIIPKGSNCCGIASKC